MNIRGLSKNQRGSESVGKCELGLRFGFTVRTGSSFCFEAIIRMTAGTSYRQCGINIYTIYKYRLLHMVGMQVYI